MQFLLGLREMGKEEEICRTLNNLGYGSLEEYVEIMKLWSEVAKAAKTGRDITQRGSARNHLGGRGRVV